MRAPYDFRDKAPSFTTISMTVPSDCPAPTKNTSKVVETSCSYEFPNSECPSDFPVLQCKQTSDCVTDDGQSFTCGGEIVACDSS